MVHDILAADRIHLAREIKRQASQLATFCLDMLSIWTTLISMIDMTEQLEANTTFDILHGDI